MKIGYGLLIEFGDGLLMKLKKKRLGLKTSSLTIRTREVGAVAGEKNPHVEFVCLSGKFGKESSYPEKPSFPFDNDIFMLGLKIFVWNIHGDLLPGAKFKESTETCLFGSPWLYGSLPEGKVFIGDHEIHVDVDDTSETSAGRAGSCWTVKRKKIRMGLRREETAAWALFTVGEVVNLSGFLNKSKLPFPEMEGLLDGINEPPVRSFLERYAIYNNE